MFRDADIIPPTFAVLSHFKSSHKSATETLFLQAVPFYVSFVVLAFLTDCSSQSASPSLSMYLNSWAVFIPFPAFPLHPFSSFSWRKDFTCQTSSPAHAQVFLAHSSLASPRAPPPPHRALYLLRATTTCPHPVSPCC